MSYELRIIDLASLPPAESVLGPREQAYYQTLRFPKRRSEWLGGRLALKQAVRAVLGPVDCCQLEVLPQETGKPLLFNGNTPAPVAFSITHSHGYAVAAATQDDTYIGIDLEKIAPRIDAWKDDFFHPSELTGAGDAFLTALWTQKEAAVKLLGTGLSINSFDVRCVNGQFQFFNKAQKIYARLGSPRITLTTWELLPGFQFSVAEGK